MTQKVWARCRKCEARRVLSMHPEQYCRIPKCRKCGNKTYTVVKRNRQTTCSCDGYWFLHREGSKDCKHGQTASINFQPLERLPMISIVFDTETTGLLLPRTAGLEKQPRIIEFGCARMAGAEIASEHNWLINPEMEISEEITKITGITNEDLVGKPTFLEVLPEIEEVFAGTTNLLAHNAHFDKTMLANELERAARTGFPWPENIICTINEYRHEFGGKNMKLTALYLRKLGRELQQTHRALDDVKAMIEILQSDNFFQNLEMQG